MTFNAGRIQGAMVRADCNWPALARSVAYPPANAKKLHPSWPRPCHNSPVVQSLGGWGMSKNRTCVALMMCAGMLSAGVQAQEPAGRALWVFGKVERVGIDGAAMPLSKGSA